MLALSGSSQVLVTQRQPRVATCCDFSLARSTWRARPRLSDDLRAWLGVFLATSPLTSQMVRTSARSRKFATRFERVAPTLKFQWPSARSGSCGTHMIADKCRQRRAGSNSFDFPTTTNYETLSNLRELDRAIVVAVHYSRLDSII